MTLFFLRFEGALVGWLAGRELDLLLLLSISVYFLFSFLCVLRFY